MNAALLIALLPTLFTSISNTAATSIAAPSLEDTIQASVVHIVTKFTECSGTMVSPTLILTARHCVKYPTDYIEIGGAGHRRFSFGKVVKSKTTDLATIEVLDSGTHAVAELSQNAAIRGDSLTIIGLSYDVPWALARGFVMSTDTTEVLYAKDPNTYHLVPMVCEGCDEGDSGSGVFNTQGKIVGVFVAQSQNNVRSLMVPLADVKVFLESVGVK